MDTPYIRIHHYPHSSVLMRHMCLIWLFPIGTWCWSWGRCTNIQLDVTLALTQVCTYRHIPLSTWMDVVYSTLKTFFLYLSPFRQSDFSSFHSFLCLKDIKNAACSIRKKLKRHNSSLYPKSFKTFIRSRVVHL